MRTRVLYGMLSIFIVAGAESIFYNMLVGNPSVFCRKHGDTSGGTLVFEPVTHRERRAGAGSGRTVLAGPAATAGLTSAQRRRQPVL